MLIDFEILEAYGSTNERLRQIATAKMPDDAVSISDEGRKRIEADVKVRQRWEERIRNRLNEHILFSLKNYKLYAAVDLAWDASPLTPDTIPLLLYAQGKIDISACAGRLQALNCADEFVKKDENGKATGIDLPKFYETQINLLRSFVTRRNAAQVTKYNNLWPFYKYEPRSTGLVAKLRADALSQRVDIMVDQFDYRHHDGQVSRDMFLYAHCVDFVRSAWECDKQWVKKNVAEELRNSAEKLPVDEKIVREGIAFVNPHPSRVFWDNAHPLSSINSDSGCRYIGFWDVCRWRDIAENPAYFNRDSVHLSGSLWDYYASYADYFNQYITNIKQPKASCDLAGSNDRRANIGTYSSSDLDASVFKSEYFEKIVPNAEGVGDYPFEVWVRHVVASDGTIIYSEFYPSTPAAYCGLNENDSRQVNISFAHELMPLQDQMTNLASQMLLMIQGELLKIITVNIDVIQNPTHLNLIRKQLQGNNFSTKPIVAEFSFSKMAELGVKIDDVIKINETRLSHSITIVFQAMLNLLSLAEKLHAMSPAELGQPAPREISATEVTEIAATTSSVYSFISDAIDEFKAAKKRICYESLASCSQGEITVPVVNRYSKKTIEKAGFRFIPDEEEDFSDPEKRRHTIVGSKSKLIHDYIFTTRDGAERPVNTQAANTLVQLLAQVINVPTVLQAMGKEKLYEIINEIFRLSGAGFDLVLELREGEDNSLGVDQMQQLSQIVQQLADAVKQNSSDLEEQKQINDTQQQALAGVNQLAQAVKKAVGDIQQLFGKIDEMKDDVNESLSYKDAPPSIRRQMERAAGYTPASDAEDHEMRQKTKAAA